MQAFRIGLAAFAALASAATLAAVPVEIEVAAVSGAPLDQLQTWAQALGKMDLERVTLRGARDGEQPAVAIEEFGGAKRVRVLALLTRNNELQLPRGRFALADAKRLEAHLRELPEALDEATIERGTFGLTQEDFARLLAAMSAPADDAKSETPTGAWLRRTTAALPAPCEWSPTAEAALAGAEPLGIDLSRYSVGMALATVLRNQGLALLPDQRRRKPLKLRIVAFGPDVDWDLAWPTGWKPEQTARQSVPEMFRSTTVEIANYSLAQALAALEGPLGAPIVLDRYALTEAKVDPAAIQVKIPRKKLLVKTAVDVCLSQGRLAGELRVDELGQPFYWVTRFGPTSPRATK
ncbi:MAG: hypothetical protein KF847_15515 [Pirellulales bacterium]|nr:hypothetical protein [Pirellulales bacterium]